MKIVKVIHGYPKRYNAGSEAYSQILCQELARQGHEVVVFTRQENAYKEQYSLEWEEDPSCPDIKVCLINMAHCRDGYRHAAVDKAFAAVLESYSPDIVHIGHLNHLSTSLVEKAHKRGCPIVYTLHDFWLLCPRGQFLQDTHIQSPDLYPICSGQEHGKCARACYWRNGTEEEDIQYWTQWVKKRMEHIHALAPLIDLYIAPSLYLKQRFLEDFPLDPSKIVYLDYGFRVERLQGRVRHREKDFVFGYIGTHKQAKGIFHLLQAFHKAFHEAYPDASLKIWGSPIQPFTSSLESYVKTLDKRVQQKIHWMGGYHNEQIVQEVLNHVDALVVPSIWGENSPLVIHEALEAKVPLITADYGGMKEYVKHEVNGLLFTHRDPLSLAQQMRRLVENRDYAEKLAQKGYLQSPDGHIPTIAAHVQKLTEYYQRLSAKKKHPSPEKSLEKIGPWRITFDTNPDDCNLHCIMCEEHSIYSSCQIKRKQEGRPRRRMDMELIRKVLKEAQGSPLREIIPSTMGEPLLFRHFEEILSLCREYQVKLNLTTNGTFPKYGATKWAELIVPVASDVKISWNGATKKTSELIMIGSHFEQRVQNVRDFIHIRDKIAKETGHYCRVTFQLTFMEIGLEEIPDVVRLAASLGVNRVKGHHLWVFVEEMKRQSLRKDAPSIQRWNQIVKKTLQAAEECRLPNGEKVFLENIYPLEESAVEELVTEGVCPFLGQEAWVSAEGEFGPCCAPNEERKKLGVFGNLQNTSIEEIWKGEPYQNLQKNYLQNKVCKTCNMRKKKEELLP